MLAALAALALALLQPAPALAQQPPASAAPSDTLRHADAYLDPVAHELVQRGRAWRADNLREIRAYSAVAKERVSVGMQMLGRERLFFRRELAARVRWQRSGPVDIEVLGARQVLPAAKAAASFVDDVEGELPSLAFDPADDRLFTERMGDTSWLRHPLAPGSEADYRFRSGGSTRLALPGGASVTLRELEVLPRRRDPRLFTGSLWLDAASHATVRTVLRLSRALDVERDEALLDPDDSGDVREIPRLLKPIRADVRFLTIEYALYHQRWWLPRLLAVDAIAEINSFPDIPVRFERAYSDYAVLGDGAPAGELPFPLADTVGRPRPVEGWTPAQCPTRVRTVHFGVSARGGAFARVGSTASDSLRPDSAAADSAVADSASGLQCVCSAGRCRYYRVAPPRDTAALLASAYLPPSAFASGETLVSGEDVGQLTRQLQALAPVPWALQRPVVRWSYLGDGLTRYNRVEGLGLGARMTADFGGLSVSATARYGVADGEPGAELALTREGLRGRLELGAYRRLAAVEPASRALGLGNSLAALLFGRDDGDYYRVRGAELIGSPLRTQPQRYAWRLYAERQRAVTRETDFSLPQLFDDGRVFRENLAAERADQLGAALTLRTRRGLDPAGWRGGAELYAEAATGGFRFARPALTLTGGFPLPARLVGGVEVAAGTSFGEVPAQSRWLLGGPATLRGYAGAAQAGTAFWRARAEVANQLPGARLVLFSDAGWAGDRAALGGWNDALLSAGVGASFLDGLVRLDLARALREPRRWRLELYLNAAL